MSMSRQAGIILPGYNPLLVANAPTIGTATAGSNLCASVAFTAPSCTGGSVISTYTAYCTTTGTNRTTGASSPLVVTGLIDGASYTFRVVATNIYGPSYPSGASNSVTAVSAGSQSYTTAGTYSWVAPANVTSVSIVAVGGGGGGFLGARGSGGSGGGLGYRNNQAVTPGTSYTVVVGAGGQGATSCVSATDGGCSYFSSTAVVNGGKGLKGFCSNSGTIAGGTFTGTGGGAGGAANNNANCFSSRGGGGAGGYSGAGGNGGITGNGFAGAGGGGGGGGGTASANTQPRGSGGGVGIFGQGSNGTAGTGGFSSTTGGGGGSGGGTGGYVAGGAYGGGGHGAQTSGCFNWFAGNGGVGAVRILWPGNTRTFPSTSVGAP